MGQAIGHSTTMRNLNEPHRVGTNGKAVTRTNRLRNNFTKQHREHRADEKAGQPVGQIADDDGQQRINCRIRQHQCAQQLIATRSNRRYALGPRRLLGRAALDEQLELERVQRHQAESSIPRTGRLTASAPRRQSRVPQSRRSVLQISPSVFAFNMFFILIVVLCSCSSFWIESV
jgi:hypothetical protein